MNTVLIVFFFISLVGFLVGLLKPSLLGLSRAVAVFLFGAATLLFLFLSLYTGPSRERLPTINQQRAATQTENFDIPSLLGKSASEIRQELADYLSKSNQPTQEQIDSGVEEWDLEFQKGSLTLVVTYNIASDEVVSMNLQTDEALGLTGDRQAILDAGYLSEDDSRYTLFFIPTENDPSTYSGAKVVLR